MAEVTVSQFAEVLKVPVEKLLTQLDEAGIKVSGADDVISDESKMELLTHLRRSHGRDEDAAAPRKITLKRKAQQEIKVASVQGRARTVSVEVRAKKTYLNRTVLEEEQRQRQDELDRVRQAEEAVRLEAEKLEAEKRDGERLERERIEQEARRRAEEEARARADDEASRQTETRDRDRLERERVEAERRAAEPARPAPAVKPRAPAETDARKGVTKYGRQELHVGGDASARFKKRQQSSRHRRPVQVSVDSRHGFELPTAPVRRDVQLPETITVGELAARMAVKANEVIKTMMKMGVMATINQPIDQDTAQLVVEEFGHKRGARSRRARSRTSCRRPKPQVELLPRPPVVTIMGHVDHGKTSLLDYIRRTKVAAGEAGGITQHIGAYQVETGKGLITFIDTPGHAAFTAMRARGANVTDIVILVVAADDGVMPQTIEAIQHARAAHVPIVVAVNKMDKGDADPDRVRNDLAKHNVIPEDWGGDTLFVHVSARTGDGIDKLLETILLQAEVLDLKAPQDGLAVGVVLESAIEKGRGPVATVLVKRGTLKAGDPIIAGQEFGRVRALFDATGKQVQSRRPGECRWRCSDFRTRRTRATTCLPSKANARPARSRSYRQGKFRDVRLAGAAKKAEDVFSQMGEAAGETVAVIVKADVQGSSEALRDALSKLSTDEVAVKVIASGVGGITESDVTLAAASRARIIGFNVRADGSARSAMKETGVEVSYYSIIYEAIDDIKAAMTGLLKPEIKEQIMGLAEVREVFRSSKFGTVAGCLVIEGFIKRGNPVRVLRDNVVIHQGELDSLRRFKDEAGEVRAGTECGIGVRNYNDIRAGDQIECFARVEVARNV